MSGTSVLARVTVCCALGAAAASATLFWRARANLREAVDTGARLARSLAAAERRLDAIEAALAIQARTLAMQVESLQVTAPARPAIPAGVPGAARGGADISDLEPTPDSLPTFAEAAERSMSEQRADFGWSREVRGQLLELIQPSSTSAGIVAVDCRVRLCRVQLQYASNADRDRMTLDLSRASAFEGGVVFEHSGEGAGARTTLYIARPGEELARVAGGIP